MKIFTILSITCCFVHMWAYDLNVPDSAESVPVPPFIDLENADFSQAPDEYEVVRGDTLWDLSQKFLKSPWYWPKLWSVNPQIKNPHLIYPGDLIGFRGSGEIMMPQTDEIPVTPSSDEGETDAFARAGKTLDSTPEDYKGYVRLGGKYRLDHFKRVENTLFDMVRRGFISADEIETSTKVVGSIEPKELMASGDNCYVELGKENHNIGDYVEIFRETEDIEDISGEILGKKIEILGKGKVIDVNNDGIATVAILKSFDAVVRGDSVRSWTEFEKNIEVVENNNKVSARILTSFDPIVFYGEGHTVFVNKGDKDGLSIGTLMTVYRRGDGLDKVDSDVHDKLPFERIGEVVIIKTERNTSVAMITKSLIGLERGDLVTVGGLD